MGLGASMLLQITLVSAVATARGHDINKIEVQTMIIGVLVGDVAAHEVMKAAAAHGPQLLFPILAQQSMAGGAAAGVAAGAAGWVPFIGPVLAFVADGGMCWGVARALDFTLLK
eukprot:m.426906 g.426906  ORF g.426906 m.426906 type:complete len:114 (-) comp60884_c0_seq1:414-755(-)